MRIFCGTCSAYFPAGATCPTCGQARPPLLTPSVPGTALWQAELPGSIGVRLAYTERRGCAYLLVPWYHHPQGTDERPPDGGLMALDPATGQTVWTCPLGAAVEGGAAVSRDVVYVGAGQRGLGAGTGWLAALALATGEELWRVPAAGVVRSTPAHDEARVYVTAGDGALHTLSARDGQPWSRVPIASRPVPMPADPALANLRGARVVIAASYSARFDRDPGRVTALGPGGQILWCVEVPGSVRGAPVVDGERVYVTAFQERPSTGLLLALSARTGDPLWPAPFTVGRSSVGGAAAGFSAGALVHAGMVYVGSLNHRLYALDAATGALRWETEAEAGIASTPAWVEGLVVFGANDGCIYAVDGATGAAAWQHAVGGHILTGPLVVGSKIFVGTDTGRVAALPWHLGHYAWAAERLEAGGRWREAGDHRAMAAHFSTDPTLAEMEYQQAASHWQRAGTPECAGELWSSLDRPAEAAAAFRVAGERLRPRDRERAARYFSRAAYRYAQLRECEPLTACTRAQSRCASLPFIRVRSVNTTLVQWEPGQLTLELINDGSGMLERGLTLSLSGALPVPVTAGIDQPLAVGQSARLPLTVTPVEPESQLEVEVVYGAGDYPALRGLFLIPLRAAARPRPPLQIGDVASLQVVLPAATDEGVAIHARDVGLMRSTTVGDVTVNAEGDIGAVMQRPRQSRGGDDDR